MLVLKQALVHLPEFTLSGGGLGGFGRQLGVGMDGCHREVTKNETNPILEMTAQFSEDGQRLATMKALMITIPDQVDRG
jgi:hypothetical protein